MAAPGRGAGRAQGGHGGRAKPAALRFVEHGGGFFGGEVRGPY